MAWVWDETGMAAYDWTMPTDIFLKRVGPDGTTAYRFTLTPEPVHDVFTDVTFLAFLNDLTEFFEAQGFNVAGVSQTVEVSRSLTEE
jgi:hypothetical protein